MLAAAPPRRARRARGARGRAARAPPRARPRRATGRRARPVAELDVLAPGRRRGRRPPSRPSQDRQAVAARIARLAIGEERLRSAGLGSRAASGPPRRRSARSRRPRRSPGSDVSGRSRGGNGTLVGYFRVRVPRGDRRLLAALPAVAGVPPRRDPRDHPRATSSPAATSDRVVARAATTGSPSNTTAASTGSRAGRAATSSPRTLATGSTRDCEVVSRRIHRDRHRTSTASTSRRSSRTRRPSA